MADLTVRNPHQPRNVDRDHLIEILISRVESGGMVLVTFRAIRQMAALLKQAIR